MTSEKALPNVIIGMAPLMEELLRLREEVRDLRMKRDPAPRELQKLLEGTPIRIDRDLATGKWRYTLRLRHGQTGGDFIETYDEAFRQAVKRFDELWFADEGDEEW